MSNGTCFWRQPYLTSRAVRCCYASSRQAFAFAVPISSIVRSHPASTLYRRSRRVRLQLRSPLSLRPLIPSITVLVAVVSAVHPCEHFALSFHLSVPPAHSRSTFQASHLLQLLSALEFRLRFCAFKIAPSHPSFADLISGIPDELLARVHKLHRPQFR